MALSPEEIELANKYINDYEKGVFMQRWSTWLIFFVSIALLATVPYLFSQVERAQEITQEINSPEYLLGGKEVNPKILVEYINARIQLVRIETGLGLRMIFPTLLGSFFLAVAVHVWSWRKRKIIFVKVLRTLLDDMQQKDKNN